MPSQRHRFSRSLASVVVVVVASTNVGCGQEDEQARRAATQVETQRLTHSTPATTTASKHSQGARSKDASSSGASSGPRSKKTRSRPRSRIVVHFRRSGNRILPPIRVRRGGAVLQWRNEGVVFTLFDADGIIVDTVAREGARRLPAARYALEIVAEGKWSIRIPNANVLRPRRR